MILGVDVGGTSIKFGIVSPKGEISSYTSIQTATLIESNGVIAGLQNAIEEYLNNFPEITGIGLGFPGYLTLDRRGILFLPNIPSVTDVPIVPILEKKFPSIRFRIENDAKCAAMGEYLYGDDQDLDNFLLLTLGTGVGSGIIIDGKLFLGVRGNAPEMGHILVGDNTLEKQIGINCITEYAKKLISKHPEQPTLLSAKEIDPYSIFQAAEKGDLLALEVFKFLGERLGQALVTVITLLDVDRILLGGGIAGAYEIFKPHMMKVIDNWLPDYYTRNLIIKKASVENSAGILGAASLLMNDKRLRDS